MVKRKRKMKRRARKERFFSPTSIVPMTKKVRFKYVQQVSLDGGLGLIASHAFRANSINDPDYSGAGHQPYGHDQMANFYHHYCVLKSRMRITPVTPSAAAVTPSYVGIFSSATPTDILTYSTVEGLLETAGRGKYLIIGGEGAASRPNKDTSLTASCDMSKLFGVKDVNGDDVYKALFGANPNEEWFMTIFAAAISGGDPGGITVLVELEYDCILSEFKHLATS